jgi:hypothetical protein
MVSFRPFVGRAFPSVLAPCIYAMALTLASSGGLQASILFSFGPDSDFDPSEFTSISPQNSTAASLYDMADATDSFGFNGGVTYRPGNGLFYAVINDSSNNASLISFALGGGGAFTNLQSLGNSGIGFLGGLTFDTADNNFYAIGADANFSYLYKINLGGTTNQLFSLSTLGFNGGLTFDSLDGNFYAISSDTFGAATMYRIALNGSVTALTGTPLGFLYHGGVVYDGPTNSFYAIDNGSGNSNLDQIVVSGSSVASVTTLFTVGSGFVNAGLTEVVPEPSTLLLFAGGAMILLLSRHRNTPKGLK